MDLTTVSAARPDRGRHPVAMPRPSLALLLLALLTLSLGGCLFDHPLTEVSSTNIDTRLLGVFEFEQNKTSTSGSAQTTGAADIVIHRVAVLPLDNSRYVIYYRDFSKKPAQVLKYTGWISRVDDAYYLTFRDENPGTPSQGKYGFFLFQWEYPGDIRLFTPDLSGLDVATSSFRIRQEVRKRLREGTLLPYDPTSWKKIARIWWDPKGAAEGTTIPPEFENGTKRTQPGL